MTAQAFVEPAAAAGRAGADAAPFRLRRSPLGWTLLLLRWTFGLAGAVVILWLGATALASPAFATPATPVPVSSMAAQKGGSQRASGNREKDDTSVSTAFDGGRDEKKDETKSVTERDDRRYEKTEDWDGKNRGWRGKDWDRHDKGHRHGKDRDRDRNEDRKENGKSGKDTDSFDGKRNSESGKSHSGSAGTASSKDSHTADNKGSSKAAGTFGAGKNESVESSPKNKKNETATSGKSGSAHWTSTASNRDHHTAPMKTDKAIPWAVVPHRGRWNDDCERAGAECRPRSLRGRNVESTIGLRAPPAGTTRPDAQPSRRWADGKRVTGWWVHGESRFSGDSPKRTEKVLETRIKVDTAKQQLEELKKQVEAGTASQADYEKAEEQLAELEQRYAQQRARLSAERAEQIDAVVDGHRALNAAEEKLAAQREKVAAGTLAEEDYQRAAAELEQQRETVYTATEELMAAVGRTPGVVPADGVGEGAVAGCGSSGVFVACGAVAEDGDGTRAADRCVALAGVSNTCRAQASAGESSASVACRLTGPEAGCTGTATAADNDGGTNTATSQCAGDPALCVLLVVAFPATAVSWCVIESGRCTGSSRGQAEQPENRLAGDRGASGRDTREASSEATCSASSVGCETSTVVNLGDRWAPTAEAYADVACTPGAAECSGEASTTTSATDRMRLPAGLPGTPEATTTAAVTCSTEGGSCRADSRSHHRDGSRRGVGGTSDGTVAVTCDTEDCTGRGRATTEGTATGVDPEAKRTSSGSSECETTRGECQTGTHTEVGSDVEVSTVYRREVVDEPVGDTAAGTGEEKAAETGGAKKAEDKPTVVWRRVTTASDGAGWAATDTWAQVDCGSAADCTGAATTTTRGEVSGPASDDTTAPATRSTTAETSCDTTAGRCEVASNAEAGDRPARRQPTWRRAGDDTRDAQDASRTLWASSGTTADVACDAPECRGQAAGSTSGSASGDVPETRDSHGAASCTIHGVGGACQLDSSTEVVNRDLLRAVAHAVDPVTGPISTSWANASITCSGGAGECGGTAYAETSALDGSVSPERRGTSATAECTVTGGSCRGEASSSASSAPDFIVIDPATGEPLDGQPLTGPSSIASSSARLDCPQGCVGSASSSATGVDGAVLDGRPQSSTGSVTCDVSDGACWATTSSVAASAPGAAETLAARDPALQALAETGTEQTTPRRVPGADSTGSHATVTREDPQPPRVTGPSSASVASVQLDCPDGCEGTAGSSTSGSDGLSVRSSEAEIGCTLADGVCRAATRSVASSGQDVAVLLPQLRDPTALDTRDAMALDDRRGGSGAPASTPGTGQQAVISSTSVPGPSSLSDAFAVVDCAEDCRGGVFAIARGADAPDVAAAMAGGTGSRGPPSTSESGTTSTCITGIDRCQAVAAAQSATGAGVAWLLDPRAEEALAAIRPVAPTAPPTGAWTEQWQSSDDEDSTEHSGDEHATDEEDDDGQDDGPLPITVSRSFGYAICGGPDCAATVVNRSTTSGMGDAAVSVSRARARCAGAATGCTVMASGIAATTADAGANPANPDETIPGVSGTTQSGATIDCSASCRGRVTANTISASSPDGGARALIDAARDLEAEPAAGNDTATDPASVSVVDASATCARRGPCVAAVSTTGSAVTSAATTPEAGRFGSTSAFAEGACTVGDSGCPVTVTGTTVATDDPAGVPTALAERQIAAEPFTAHTLAVADCESDTVCQAGTGGVVFDYVTEAFATCFGEECRSRVTGVAVFNDHRAEVDSSCATDSLGACMTTGRAGATPTGALASAGCEGVEASCTYRISVQSAASSHTGGHSATAEAACQSAGGSGAADCATTAVAETSPEHALAAAGCEGSENVQCRYSYRAESHASARGAYAGAVGHGSGEFGSGMVVTTAAAASGPGWAQASASCTGTENTDCRHWYGAEVYASASYGSNWASASASGSGGGGHGGGGGAVTASAGAGPGYAWASASCSGAANCRHYYSASASASASDGANWASASASGSGGGGQGGGNVSVSASAAAGPGYASASASCSGAANCSTRYEAHAESTATATDEQGVWEARHWASCSGSGGTGCAVQAQAVAGPQGGDQGGTAQCWGDCSGFTHGGTNEIVASLPTATQPPADAFETLEPPTLDEGESGVEVTRSTVSSAYIVTFRSADGRSITRKCSKPCELTGFDGQRVVIDESGVQAENPSWEGRPPDVCHGAEGCLLSRDSEGNGEFAVIGEGWISDGVTGSQVNYNGPQQSATEPGPAREIGNLGNPVDQQFRTTCHNGCNGDISNGKGLTDHIEIEGTPDVLVGRDAHGGPGHYRFPGKGTVTLAENHTIEAHGERPTADDPALLVSQEAWYARYAHNPLVPFEIKVSPGVNDLKAPRTDITTPDAFGGSGHYVIEGGQTGRITLDNGYSVEQRASSRIVTRYHNYGVYSIGVVDVVGEHNRIEVITPDGNGRGGSITCAGTCSLVRPDGMVPAPEEVADSEIHEPMIRLGETPSGPAYMIYRGEQSYANVTPPAQINWVDPYGNGGYCAPPKCRIAVVYHPFAGVYCEGVGCHATNASGQEAWSELPGDDALHLLIPTPDGGNTGYGCKGGPQTCTGIDPDAPDKSLPYVGWPGDPDESWMAVLDPSYVRLAQDTAIDRYMSQLLGVPHDTPLPPLPRAAVEWLEHTDPDKAREYRESLPPLTDAQRAWAVVTVAGIMASEQRIVQTLHESSSELNQFFTDLESGNLGTPEPAALDEAIELGQRLALNRMVLDGIAALSGERPPITAAQQAAAANADLPSYEEGFAAFGLDLSGEPISKLSPEDQARAYAAQVAGLNLLARTLALNTAAAELTELAADYERALNAGQPLSPHKAAELSAKVEQLLAEEQAIREIGDRIGGLNLPEEVKPDLATLRDWDMRAAVGFGDPQLADRLRTWDALQGRAVKLAQQLAGSTDPRQQQLAEKLSAFAGVAELTYNSFARDMGLRDPYSALGELALPSSGRPDVFFAVKSAANRHLYEALTDEQMLRYFRNGGADLHLDPVTLELVDSTWGYVGSTPEDRLAEFAARGTPDELLSKLSFRLTPDARNLPEDLPDEVKSRIRDLAAEGTPVTVYMAIVTDPETNEQFYVPFYQVTKVDGTHRYIDLTGAHYSSLQDFREHNQLFPDGTPMLAPDHLGGELAGLQYVSTTAKYTPTWRKVADWTAAGVAFVGIGFLAVGGTALTATGAGAAAGVPMLSLAGWALTFVGGGYFGVQAVRNFNERRQRGQSNSWSNPYARSDYLILGSMLVPGVGVVVGKTLIRMSLRGSGLVARAFGSPVTVGIPVGGLAWSAASVRTGIFVMRASGAIGMGLFAWDVGSNLVDTVRYWDAMSTGQRIESVVGLTLSAVSMGLVGGMIIGKGRFRPADWTKAAGGPGLWATVKPRFARASLLTYRAALRVRAASGRVLSAITRGRVGSGGRAAPGQPQGATEPSAPPAESTQGQGAEGTRSVPAGGSSGRIPPAHRGDKRAPEGAAPEQHPTAPGRRSNGGATEGGDTAAGQGRPQRADPPAEPVSRAQADATRGQRKQGADPVPGARPDATSGQRAAPKGEAPIVDVQGHTATGAEVPSSTVEQPAMRATEGESEGPRTVPSEGPGTVPPAARAPTQAGAAQPSSPASAGPATEGARAVSSSAAAAASSRATETTGEAGISAPSSEPPAPRAQSSGTQDAATSLATERSSSAVPPVVDRAGAPSTPGDTEGASLASRNASSSADDTSRAPSGDRGSPAARPRVQHQTRKPDIDATAGSDQVPATGDAGAPNPPAAPSRSQVHGHGSSPSDPSPGGGGASSADGGASDPAFAMESRPSGGHAPPPDPTAGTASGTSPPVRLPRKTLRKAMGGRDLAHGDTVARDLGLPSEAELKKTLEYYADYYGREFEYLQYAPGRGVLWYHPKPRPGTYNLIDDLPVVRERIIQYLNTVARLQPKLAALRVALREESVRASTDDHELLARIWSELKEVEAALYAAEQRLDEYATYRRRAEAVLRPYRPLINEVREIRSDISQHPERYEELKNAPLGKLTAVQKAALVSEAIKRKLGVELYDDQIAAALVMTGARLPGWWNGLWARLRRGVVVRLATGEGKTYVLVMAAHLRALDNQPVTLMFHNDQLAVDAFGYLRMLSEELNQITIALRTARSPRSRRAIREAYQAHIVSAGKEQVIFDTLGEELAWLLAARNESDEGGVTRGVKRPVPGRHLLVDEIDFTAFGRVSDFRIALPVEDALDSVPMLLGGKFQNVPMTRVIEMAKLALEVLKFRQGGSHHRGAKVSWAELDEIARHTGRKLTVEDKELLERLLRVRMTLREGREYIIENNEVVIIDRNNGERLEGQRYRDQRLLEALAIAAGKIVRITPLTETVMRTTMLRFFRMQLSVNGVTATPGKRWWWLFFLRMGVVWFPTRGPRLLVELPRRIFVNDSYMWKSLIDFIVKIRSIGDRGRLSDQDAVIERISRDVEQDVQEKSSQSSHVGRVGQDGAVGEDTPSSPNRNIRPIIVVSRDILEVVELYAALVSEFRKAGILGEGRDVGLVTARLVDERYELLNRAIAGRPGAVTIATAKLGRGVDPKLGGDPNHPGLALTADEAARARKEIADEGGLISASVRLSELGDPYRQQIFGRAGRQGDPGEARELISLEDPVVQRYGNATLVYLLRRQAVGGEVVGERATQLTNWVIGWAERKARIVQLVQLGRGTPEYENVRILESRDVDINGSATDGQLRKAANKLGKARHNLYRAVRKLDTAAGFSPDRDRTGDITAIEPAYAALAAAEARLQRASESYGELLRQTFASVLAVETAPSTGDTTAEGGAKSATASDVEAPGEAAPRGGKAPHTAVDATSADRDVRRLRLTVEDVEEVREKVRAGELEAAIGSLVEIVRHVTTLLFAAPNLWRLARWTDAEARFALTLLGISHRTVRADRARADQSRALAASLTFDRLAALVATLEADTAAAAASVVHLYEQVAEAARRAQEGVREESAPGDEPRGAADQTSKDVDESHAVAGGGAFEESTEEPGGRLGSHGDEELGRTLEDERARATSDDRGSTTVYGQAQETTTAPAGMGEPEVPIPGDGSPVAVTSREAVSPSVAQPSAANDVSTSYSQAVARVKAELAAFEKQVMLSVQQLRDIAEPDEAPALLAELARRLELDPRILADVPRGERSREQGSASETPDSQQTLDELVNRLRTQLNLIKAASDDALKARKARDWHTPANRERNTGRGLPRIESGETRTDHGSASVVPGAAGAASGSADAAAVTEQPSPPAAGDLGKPGSSLTDGPENRGYRVRARGPPWERTVQWLRRWGIPVLVGIVAVLVAALLAGAGYPDVGGVAAAAVWPWRRRAKAADDNAEYADPRLHLLRERLSWVPVLAGRLGELGGVGVGEEWVVGELAGVLGVSEVLVRAGLVVGESRVSVLPVWLRVVVSVPGVGLEWFMGQVRGVVDGSVGVGGGSGVGGVGLGGGVVGVVAGWGRRVGRPANPAGPLGPVALVDRPVLLGGGEVDVERDTELPLRRVVAEGQANAPDGGLQVLRGAVEDPGGWIGRYADEQPHLGRYGRQRPDGGAAHVAAVEGLGRHGRVVGHQGDLVDQLRHLAQVVGRPQGQRHPQRAQQVGRADERLDVDGRDRQQGTAGPGHRAGLAENRQQMGVPVPDRFEVVVNAVEAVVEHLGDRPHQPGADRGLPQVQLLLGRVRPEPGLHPHAGQRRVQRLREPAGPWPQARIERAVVREGSRVDEQVADPGRAQLISKGIHIGLRTAAVDPGVAEPQRVVAGAARGRARGAHRAGAEVEHRRLAGRDEQPDEDQQRHDHPADQDPSDQHPSHGPSLCHTGSRSARPPL